jgi:hypothetical protein
LITSLVTKGKGDTTRNHWVTKYKVSYSNDSVLWTYYKDANHLEPKVSSFQLILLKLNLKIRNYKRNLVAMQTNKWKELII